MGGACRAKGSDPLPAVLSRAKGSDSLPAVLVFSLPLQRCRHMSVACVSGCVPVSRVSSPHPREE